MRIEGSKFPDGLDIGGYKVLSLPEIGGFAACDDDGRPVSPTFSTKEEAIVWTVENPRNQIKNVGRGGS
ncbi:hypothetical protein [Phyllobacterium ifriqiyense]|uniref:hypothetical protein n=1 Tax=Phyllobacterium ifriqiyense TaxID=314238 RepID=UPI00339B2FF8